MAKDSRSFDYPPGAREEMDALSDYISARTVALILSKGGAVDVGSATAIRIGERCLLATAGHNLWDLPLDDQIRIMPRESGGRLAFERRSHPPRGRQQPDVGWLEVDSSAAAAARLRFFLLDDLEIGRRHTPTRPFFVQGYPAAEVRVLPSSPQASLDLLSMGLATLSLPPAAGRDELALEYPPQSEGDVGLELPHPRGVSGGGIYVLPAFDPAGVWTPEQAKLVGIARSFDEPTNRLTTSPIELWLDMVAQDLADLGSSIGPVLRS